MAFERWCRHYGYDPASEEAAADYRRYREELELVRSLFQTGDGSAAVVARPN